MDIKKFGRDLKGSLQNAADAVKEKTKELNIPDAKQAGDKVSEKINGILKKSDNKKPSLKNTLKKQSGIKISVRAALKIIYFLMSADEKILPGEEEQFDSVGKELDANFHEYKEQLIKECQSELNKVIDPEDYFDILRDGIDSALNISQNSETVFVAPKLLIWDLLSVAYSDGEYSDIERRLLKYVVRKSNIDKAVFLEMESSMMTLLDIQRESDWIKTTDRPYLEIEAMVNEIAERKNVIFESVLDLISL